MTPPSVLLDCDGVVADFLGYYLSLAEKLTGETFHNSQVTQWEIAKALGLSPEVEKVIDAAISLPGVARRFMVLPGAVQGVTELDQVATIDFLTANGDTALSSPTWCFDRSMWLREHFGFQIGKNVIFCPAKRKHKVSGDYLVDDRLDVIETWAAANPQGVGVLWDAPYNRAERLPANAVRMNSWAELNHYVRERIEVGKRAERVVRISGGPICTGDLVGIIQAPVPDAP